jgi:hypothetical protein
VNTDMSWEQFKDLCRECWQKKHNFVTIDKERDINKMIVYKNRGVPFNLTPLVAIISQTRQHERHLPSPPHPLHLHE